MGTCTVVGGTQAVVVVCTVVEVWGREVVVVLCEVVDVVCGGVEVELTLGVVVEVVGTLVG